MLVFNSSYHLITISMLYMSIVAAASDFPLVRKQPLSVADAQYTSSENNFFHVRISEYKEKAVKTWQELPVWGKCLAGGAATVGIFGSLCFVNYLRQEPDAGFDNIAIIRNISADEARDALSKGVDDAHELLNQLSSDRARVAVLKEVFCKIISESYTDKEQVILKNLLQGFQPLFGLADWQELHQYACDNEAAENDYQLRDWFTANFTIQHD